MEYILFYIYKIIRNSKMIKVQIYSSLKNIKSFNFRLLPNCGIKITVNIPFHAPLFPVLFLFPAPRWVPLISICHIKSSYLASAAG